MRFSRISSKYPERIELFDPTHTMRMTNPISISVKTENRYSVLFQERVYIIDSYKSLNVIILNSQSIKFTS